VLELEDLEDRPLDLDVVSIFELVGVDDGRSALSEPSFNAMRVKHTSDWPSAGLPRTWSKNQSTSLAFDFACHLTNSACF
jgi:hypothetical protein